MKKKTLIADTKHPVTGKILIRGSFDNADKTLTKLYKKQHENRIICNRIASDSRNTNKY